MAMTTPYLIEFGSQLEPGQNIIIKGSLADDHRFNINFSTGPDMVYQKSTGDDVALHISYSPGSRQIILNSFQKNIWEHEEHMDASMIGDQALFEIRVLVQHDRYEIFVDNVKIGDFIHRLPLHVVGFLYVVGGITLQMADIGKSRPQREAAAQAHALEKLDTNVLVAGNAIAVRGAPNGQHFDINFSTGPDMVYKKNTGDDIALHVSYSGGGRRILLNSFQEGYWREELQYDAPSIQQGVTCEIRIEIYHDRFGISVDNQRLADFPFRMPLNQIHYIYVVGDINFESLNTGAKGKSDQTQNDSTGPQPTPEEPSQLQIPYRMKLPQNFSPGHKLIIQGMPKSDATQFQINLYAGHLNAFHNMANFNEKVLCRDSRTKGEDWDKNVESDSKCAFPYESGKQFQIVYVCEEGAFQIYIDGVHHFTYKHRLPPNKINALAIEGQAKIYAVKYE